MTQTRESTAYSPTPDLVTFVSPLRLEPLDPAGVERLKEATLEVLEQVGVAFPCERALEVFKAHGAAVEGEVVRLTPALVEGALRTAPRSFLLGGREPRFDLTLDGRVTYLATEGVGVRVRDLETGEERASRKADVAMMARVVDALPAISFFWPPVSAQDHPRTAPVHECHAGLTNTLKHVRGATTMHPALARRTVEMARIVAGGDEAMRARPPICGNICTISPLAQDATGIEAALVYAEAGIPFSFMAMPTMGSTAPASVLGALVQGEAEVLAGVVLIQLAFPGAKVFHSTILSLMEPRSGGYLGELEAPVELIACQMAHAWGVPNITGPTLSGDADSVGWAFGSHAGLEAALLALCDTEIGGDLGGLLHGSTVLEPHLIVLQHDLMMRALRLTTPLDPETDDLALDVIASVGPRGHYLAHRHTRQHMRDFALPLPVRMGVSGADRALPPRRGGGSWDEAEAAARLELERILRDHQPESLPEDVLEALDKVLEMAEQDAATLG
jgi:trimethylamine:corrinoid methyltransferase-like protein